MPPLSTVLTSFSLDPVALAVIVAAGTLYARGLALSRAQGHGWPIRRSVAFYALGLGSFAWVSFGFLGTFSSEVQWTFATRVALLLFVVPALVGLGRPLVLARQAMTNSGVHRLDVVLNSRLIRFTGNAVFEPIFGVALFLLFLTRFAGEARTNHVAEWGITLVMPVIGLITVLPIFENIAHHTSFFVTIEFVLAFAALVFDPIPGILLRLSGSVIDPLARASTAVSWMPNPLRDQQLTGDLLWFIAEIVDLPILIILIIRWSRIERHEAASFDELDDDEFEALAREHLRGPAR
jgi:cytochrome c oxidase assembly factor CtaG